MTERSGSLFPSVGTSTSTSSRTSSTPDITTTSTATSWLQNSSFPEHLVQQLNSVSAPYPSGVKTSDKTSSFPERKDSKRRKTDAASSDKKKKKKHKKHKKQHKEVENTFDIYELLYKGDKDNYRYGQLYSYDIPAYKTFIKCCLGDTTKSQFKSSDSRPSSHDYSSRYFKKISAPELTLQHRSRFLRVDADYISLTVSSQCWEPAEPVIAVLDPSKSDPSNVDKWMQFIESTGTTKAGLERRYEICQKARKFLPQNLDILKKTIDTAKRFMSNQQIGRVWTDMLFHHPNKLEMWLEYLRYKSTNLTELNISSVVGAYRKCLQTMFGFQQETFRSHKFEGDIEAALVEVSAQFIKLLYDMGYTEKASAYCSALLDISTSKSDKNDYLIWYNKGCTLLGSTGYVDWWNSNVTSSTLEVITQIPGSLEDVDVWKVWLEEERRKGDFSFSPIARNRTEELVDPECSVSSPWLRQFLYCSEKPELLFESFFRAHLPDNVAKIPLLALFHCHINLPNIHTEFLTRLCEQLYSRLENQTVIGICWTLLIRLKSSDDKTTSKFVKGLLKHPSHRNNMTYWSLYTDFLMDKQVVLQKLLKTPLSPFHTAVLENKLATCQNTQVSTKVEDIDLVDRRVEELICKPISSTTETLHLGTKPTNLWCNNYTARTHLSLQPALSQPAFSQPALSQPAFSQPALSQPALSQPALSPFDPVQYLLDYISRLVVSSMSRDQVQADLLVIFNHVIQTELLLGNRGNVVVIKKTALLAVEQFPQIPMFWNVLKKYITMTTKVWDRLLKSAQEDTWYNRVLHECAKQDSHPDIDLSNRILSLALSSIEIFPQSRLLWKVYVQITEKYDKKSLKSVLIRSIKENPSRKQSYLQAIHLCPEEAETVYELIEEKQIRLQTLIEEIQMFAV